MSLAEACLGGDAGIRQVDEDLSISDHRSDRLVGAACSEHHEPQHPGGDTGRGTEISDEPLHISIGKRWVMARYPLEPFRKPLAELFGELGRIAKILVIDVYVLRDDRLYPAANPIGGFTLLKPDRPEQFIDMAGPYLWYSGLTDRRIGVSLER
jgi:hypothetical protein